MEQPDLFSGPAEEGDGHTAAQRFADFHAANPHVYTALVRLTRQLRQRGHDRIGIGMVYEVVRWEQLMSTDDPHSGYRLNNTYRSRYARLIMEQEPDLAGVFETRRLVSA